VDRKGKKGRTKHGPWALVTWCVGKTRSAQNSFSLRDSPNGRLIGTATVRNTPTGHPFTSMQKKERDWKKVLDQAKKASGEGGGGRDYQADLNRFDTRREEQAQGNGSIAEVG